MHRGVIILVVGAMKRKDWKKIFAFFLLMIPPIATLFSEWFGKLVKVPSSIAKFDKGNYFPYFAAVGLVFVISLIMVYVSPWYFFKRGEKENGEKPISHFFKHFIGRVILGEGLRSFYGLFLFVLLAVITTAWLPDSIANREVLKAVGTVIYLISVIFVTAWVYEPKTEKTPSIETLVYGLSGTKGWEAIEQFECEDLKRNKEKNGIKLNLIPLYISIWLHAHKKKSLERIFLLYTDAHSKDKNKDSQFKPEVKEHLRKFFEKASECMNIAFEVYWPHEGPEIIGRGEKTIEVKFIYVGSGNDVLEVKEKLGESKELQQLLKERSEKVVFHVTGGTAVMTAAMMFEAIKGDAQAEYTVQGKYDEEPEKIIKSWNITPDIIPDVWEAFEWFFERRGL